MRVIEWVPGKWFAVAGRATITEDGWDPESEEAPWTPLGGPFTREQGEKIERLIERYREIQTRIDALNEGEDDPGKTNQRTSERYRQAEIVEELRRAGVSVPGGSFGSAI